MHAYLSLIGRAANLRPRYNLAPSQSAAVVRSDADGRRLSLLRWGLIPAWAKKPSIGHRLINARVETAAVKPSFRAAFAKRRCLVPADGFYEWRREGSVREPWFIFSRDGEPMAFAGLWERWRVPQGVELPGSLAEHRPGDLVETFAILTTEANAIMRSLHDRMPVILPPEVFQPWLSGDEVELGPASNDLLAMHRVDRAVNNPRYDGPGCLAALAAG